MSKHILTSSHIHIKPHTKGLTPFTQYIRSVCQKRQKTQIEETEQASELGLDMVEMLELWRKELIQV